MNRIALVSLFFLFLLATVSGQVGFWEEAPGPDGGNVVISPTASNIVYATHASGWLYRSQDFGVHWERFNPTPVDTASVEEKLIIGYSGKFYTIVTSIVNLTTIRKLYHSLDEGTTWTLINSDIPIDFLTETQTGALIGHASLDKIYRSINGGTTWEVVHTTNVPLSLYENMFSLPDGKIMLASNETDKDYFFSENNGLTWTERSLPNVIQYPFLVPSGTIIAVPEVVWGAFYRSDDYGATFDTVAFTFILNEKPRSIIGLNNGRLLLSTSIRLLFSDDDGITWQPLPDTPEMPWAFLISKPLSNGDLLGQRNFTTFRSSDNGATWTFSSTGIRKAQIRQLALVTDSIQLAYSYTGLWRSNDMGENWTRLLADTSKSFIYNRHPLGLLSSDSFVVCMGRQLWASTNGGTTFSQVTPAGGVTKDNQLVYAAFGQILFCNGVAGVMRSNNLGNTWVKVLPQASMYALAQHPVMGLFAFTVKVELNNPVRLWRSADLGETWSEITNFQIPLNNLSSLVMDAGGNVHITRDDYFNHSTKLAISANAGATWTYKTIPEAYAGSELAINDIGLIFTSAGSNIQIMTSADGGDSWYFLPNSNFSLSVYDDYNGLEVSPSGHLYVVPSWGSMFRTTASTEIGAFIRGNVRRDADTECSTPDAQEPLKNWTVAIEGETSFYASTNADGRYTFFADTGTYAVRAVSPQNLWWGLCDSMQIVESDSLFSSDTVDFAAIALAECPLISVSVGVPRLRRCFDNNAYVQYCNPGTETADSAWVDVFLDEFLALVSADLPHEALGNNTYRFQLGSVASGECDQFGLVVHVDCDSTVLGQTHCIAAHAYPDTLCTPVPNWSGATVVAEAECQDTVVALRLRNIGPVQSQSLNYIIIEDDVVLMQGQDDYIPGEQLTLERPANGHTWRIESQQEPGHPFSSVAVAFLEGCGGYESLGFVNQFGVNTFEYSWDQVCLENIGAYDPNDKQGLPLGYGEQHRIRPGQELDYMIRFQNTGTDTAFNIVVRDTLSPWLDPASVRPGAASHPYTWTLSGTGALQFTFANILLPDSNTNLLGSQGFVRFRVSQRPEVPIGAQIFNEAAIYFDFNAPIITNRTLHTVGIDYITSTSERPGTERPDWVTVSPNPVRDAAVFQRKDGQFFEGHRITVTNALGRVVWEQKITGEHGRFTRRGLPSGVYFFRVEDVVGRPVDSGKLVVGF